jgi:hypothetical protein
MMRVIKLETGYREMSENPNSNHECIEDYMVLAGELPLYAEFVSQSR